MPVKVGLRDSKHHTGALERDICIHSKQLQYYYVQSLKCVPRLTQADAVTLLEKKIKFADHPIKNVLTTFVNQLKAQGIVTTEKKVKTQSC